MTRSILFLLLAFLALGAIGGGGLLILSPNGEWMGLPLYILKASPFTSFLIPGVILFCVFGIAPAVMILALQRKPDYRWAEMVNFLVICIGPGRSQSTLPSR